LVTDLVKQVEWRKYAWL